MEPHLAFWAAIAVGSAVLWFVQPPAIDSPRRQVSNTLPPPPPLSALGALGTMPRSAYTTRGAFAVCERCNAAAGCEDSLAGLVAAETDHALTGCNGMMRLKSINDMAREGRLKLPGPSVEVRPRSANDPPPYPEPTSAPGPGILASR